MQWIISHSKLRGGPRWGSLDAASSEANQCATISQTQTQCIIEEFKINMAVFE